MIGVVVLSGLWYVNMKLKDDRSFLFQLREMIWPSEYSQGQEQNFKSDLASIAKQWKYHDLGKKYFEAGEYEKSIEEYKKAIEIAKQEPRDWARLREQKFPRARLIHVYEAAGRFDEAIEQIDWLLAHGPSDSVRLELLAWKNVIMAERNGEYKAALTHVETALNSDDLKKYKYVTQRFIAKRGDLQQKLLSEKAALTGN